MPGQIHISSPQLRPETRRRLERDLGDRTIKVTPSIILLQVLLLLGTGLYKSRPVECALILLYFLTTLGLRLILIYAHKHQRLPRWIHWRPSFFTLSILVACTWGVISTLVIHDHGLGFPTFYLSFIMSGVVGASSNQFSIDLALGRAAVAVLLLPIVVSLLVFVGDGNAILMATIVLLATLFWSDNTVNAHVLLWNAILGEEKIRSQRDQLNTILNSIPGFVCWINADKRYISINDRFAQHLNIESLEAEKSQDEAFTEIPQLKETFDKFHASSTTKEMMELQLEFASGPRWHLITMQKFGSPLQPEILVMTLDIEEQKRAEADLESVRAKGIEASRLSALGVLAGGVAHEINNPLAILKGRLEQIRLLLESPPNSHHSKRSDPFVILDKANTTIDRIARIIKGLLTLSREDSNLAPEKVSINALLEDINAVYAPHFHKNNISFQVSTLTKDIEIMGRFSQIGQILITLINNSFDAIETLDDKWIRLEAKDLPDTILIAIEDSGSGIPKDVADQVFNPFFTTKAVGKGTGLGLSIARSLAEQHRGDLSIDPYSSHTRFVLTLPKDADVTSSTQKQAS